MRTWTVDDVMTEAVTTVGPEASYREVVDLLIGRRISAMPVVDDSLRVIGVVSETDLLRKIEYAGDERPRLFDGRRRRGERAKATGGTVAGLMTAPPVLAVSGTPIAAAARLMDAGNVKRLPVVDAADRLIGIVTRSDLLKTHLRPDDEIRDDVRSGVTGVDVEVRDGVVTLSGRVDRASTADAADLLARRVPGVVTVVQEIHWVWDDRRPILPYPIA
ncbi:CBS domain-containing protein [Actinoplanes utahensis]|uniref:Cbs domain-containing membrane protein n=1 Tax=Actinoplanes utahensis TaxID=1869 RepID=A0A0A6X615_ACTUT|nr:CBS domain-containing protein [Actinoplanes utahensis]KHD75557.1 cbs domain-containing membrane protein [Actinoplanes utahensis]GIF32364.1 hypothetical protein Aut01nite_53500 [Actinoplanes utahensis]